MLNGISRKDRIERTLSGIHHQIEDFFFIIEDHVKTLSEEEMMGLYELSEDIDNNLCDCGETKRNFMHNCPNSSNMPEIFGCPKCDDVCPFCIDGNLFKEKDK